MDQFTTIFGESFFPKLKPEEPAPIKNKGTAKEIRESLKEWFYKYREMNKDWRDYE